MDQAVTGTWIHPSGARAEITQAADGMCQVRMYLFRKGSRPVGEGRFNDREIAEKVQALEALGYVRVSSPAP